MTIDQDNPMNTINTETHAASLRDTIERERAEADQLIAEEGALAIEHGELAQRRASIGEFPSSERSEWIKVRRGDIARRLREITGNRERRGAELREFERKTNAQPNLTRAAAARIGARAALREAETYRATIAAAIDKLTAQKAAHAAGGHASHNGRIAALLARVGIKAGTTTADAKDFDAAAHERAGRDIDDAIAVATAKLEQASRAVEVAQQAVEEADRDYAATVADVAELAHADALDGYVQSLARFVAAHNQAYGWYPNLPALAEMIEGALPAAEQEFIASMTTEPATATGKPARGLKALLS